jgi:hypothetical protein
MMIIDELVKTGVNLAAQQSDLQILWMHLSAKRRRCFGRLSMNSEGARSENKANNGRTIKKRFDETRRGRSSR